jgi:hypothetical protein
MARPRSIYERNTTSTIPPPEFREKLHQVHQGECLLSISNIEHQTVEYEPSSWREIGLANNVENPFVIDVDYLGRNLRIPSKPLPDFE